MCRLLPSTATPNRQNHAIFRRCQHLWLPDFEREAVAKEAVAQFEKFRQSGLPLWHLDSHHHVHTDWSIASIILPLAKSAGFKTIRLSRNYGNALSPMKRFYKYFLNKKMNRSITANADFFCVFGDLINLTNQITKDCTIEVMTHPVYSIGHSLDLNGILTDSFDDKAIQKFFWSSNHNAICLYDYTGRLS